MPNKLFEYLMAGLAVVTPHLETLGPLVTENGIGLTYEPGSPDGLPATLERLAADRAPSARCARVRASSRSRGSTRTSRPTRSRPPGPADERRRIPRRHDPRLAGLPGAVEPPRLPDALARRLIRLEEHESAHRDRWGRWEYGFSESFQAGTLLKPELDVWVAERRAELDGSVELVPLWPDGLRFAVCLTHDVDLLSARSTPAQALRSARAGTRRAATWCASPAGRAPRAPPRRRQPRPFDARHVERRVAMESERGATASYLFTVPPVGGPGRYDCVYAPADLCRFRGEARPVAEVMRLLADEGFDVGLHGSYHASARPGALAAERATLEDATGLRVVSTRQHLLHWDVRWSPQLQRDAGLRVDSSLGFNRNVGFRAGTSLPFRLFDAGAGTRLELLEVPLVAQDVALLDAWGLELDLPLAQRVVAGLLDGAAALGTAVTLVFHPDKLALTRLARALRMDARRRARRGGWLTSLAGLADWWERREAGILEG